MDSGDIVTGQHIHDACNDKNEQLILGYYVVLVQEMIVVMMMTKYDNDHHDDCMVLLKTKHRLLNMIW